MISLSLESLGTYTSVFGFAEHYTMLPFKGLYLHSTEKPGAFRTHIYTTAIPAFWREQYQGLENFSIRELLAISTHEIALLIRNDFNFKQLAISELKKYRKKNMV